MKATRHFFALLLSVFVLIFCFAGVTNFDSMVLKPKTTDTNALDVQTSGGVSAFKVDKDGAITMAGTPSLSATTTTLSNIAATLNVGTAASTTGSKVQVFDGGSDNKPGALALYSDDGTAGWLFRSTAGHLRYHTAYPADDDSDGDIIGTFDVSLDLDLTASGGSTGDPDLSVAGYAKFAGDLEVVGAVLFNGAVSLGDAGADIVTVNSDDFRFTADAKVTFPATAYFTQLRIGTGATPDDAGAVAADGLFVEGAAEIDGTLLVDGAVTASVGVGTASGYSLSVGAAPIATAGLVLPALGADPAAAPSGFIVIYFNSADDQVKAIDEHGTAIILGDFSP